MRVIILVVIIAIFLGVLNGGCGAAPAVAVTIPELISVPGQYSGRTVIVEGIYLRGWEWVLLAEGAVFVGEGDFRELQPAGELIWFAGLMPKETQDGLYQYTSPAGDTTYYGKIKVTGLFETEGKYGHMNRYKYRITAEKVELVEWAPLE